MTAENTPAKPARARKPRQATKPAARKPAPAAKVASVKPGRAREGQPALGQLDKGDTFVLVLDGRKYARMGAKRADGRISIRDLESGKLRHLAADLAIKGRKPAAS